jgi:hypothetical protein
MKSGAPLFDVAHDVRSALSKKQSVTRTTPYVVGYRISTPYVVGYRIYADRAG